MLPGLLQNAFRAKVSIDRLVSFLNRPEVQMVTGGSEGRIICRDATVGWPTNNPTISAEVDGLQPFCLRNIDFALPQGGLTLVVGPLGSGKTLLVSVRRIISYQLTAAPCPAW